ncbi:MAG: HAMP domain-containing protein [Elusimicrobia bacterium]|nr:HAMP domain-containing protein [Elusimicrobiota bacterium]
MSISKLGLKLSIITSILVLAVIGTMARYLLQASRDAFLAEMRVRAEAFARASREAVFPKVDPFALHFNVQELMTEKAVVCASILDDSGKALSHSDPAKVGEKDASPEALNALKAQAPLLQSYAGPDGSPYFDFAVPVLVRAKRVATARVGFTKASVDSALKRSKRQIVAVAGVAVVAAVFGTALLVGWLMRPLPMLAAAARRIGRGELETRVEWRSKDEIGVLARAFNEMAVANQLAFAALREEKEKLDTLFSETRDGLILTDTHGRFLLVNPTARRLLGFGDSSPSAAPPRGVVEAFKGFTCEPKTAELLEREARNAPFELRRKEPKLLVISGIRDRLETTRGPAGLLWVFRDTTLEKKEEVLSRSVLSLISHKMKTPLMACMGYLEILAKDPPDLKGFHRQAFDSMMTQHQRLSSMVEKLLFFASVYSPDMLVLDKKPCDVAELTQRAAQAVEELFETAGVRLRHDPAAMTSLPPVLVDAGRVQEVFRNLLENAAKFNPRPDKEVEIRARAEGRKVRVSNIDNGPGIPEEEHHKLFRKLFQVEDGFTGQVDGMGLGLAYAKNVAEAHGGEIGVRSAPGKGSEFFVILPAA